MMHETKDRFLYPSLRVFSSLSSFSLIFSGKNYSYFYFPCQKQRKRALQIHRLATKLLPWSLEQAIPLIHSHQYDHFNQSARLTEFDSDQNAYMDTRLSIRVVYYYL